MPRPAPRTLRRAASRSAGCAAAAGSAGLGYAWWEARRFVVRRETLAVLPPGAPDLRVLHLSDLHVTPYQHRKRAWVRSLADLDPDLVVSTGDNLAHREAVPAVLDDLRDLLQVPGVFVLGSNDYFSPTFRNPVTYLLPDRGKRYTSTRQLPWRELRGAFQEAGWRDLSNRRDRLDVRGVRLAFAGLDDPHLGYDRLEVAEEPAEPDADLRLGVTHAPYLRVLDRLAAAGYDVVLAGHTHGGQLCLPNGRAIVTNCDLDPARAKGLSRHPATSRPGDPGSSWLHVSAGAGTSPYAAFRFRCRPEATLLTLTPTAPLTPEPAAPSAAPSAATAADFSPARSVR